MKDKRNSEISMKWVCVFAMFTIIMNRMKKNGESVWKRECKIMLPFSRRQLARCRVAIHHFRVQYKE